MDAKPMPAKKRGAFPWLAPVAALLFGIAAAYVFLSGESTREAEPAANTTDSPQSAATAGAAGEDARRQPDAEVAADARHEDMVAAYAGLEQDRRTLAERLGLLKAQLWQVELKPDQSEALTRVMLQGHALLKDRPLLGAFAEPVEIEQERARLAAVQSGLDELAPMIEAARAAAGGSPGR